MSLDPSRRDEFVGENGVRNGVRMLKISRKLLTENARRTPAYARHTTGTRHHTRAHARSRGTRRPAPKPPRGAAEAEFAYKKGSSGIRFWLLHFLSFDSFHEISHTHTYILIN